MDSENFFMKFQEFLKEKGNVFDTIDDALNAFVLQLDEEDLVEISEEEKRQIDSLELLQKATTQKSMKKRGKLIQQALELWPDNLDAKILFLEFEKPFGYLQGLAEIWDEEIGKKLYEHPDPEYDLYRGLFWSFAHHYGLTLFSFGMLAEAQEVYEFIFNQMNIKIPEVAYELMTIYALRQLWDKAMELYSNLGPLQEVDLAIVPLLILAILLRKNDEASKLHSQLKQVSTGLEEFLDHDMESFDEDMILTMVNEYEYSGRTNTIQSVGFALFAFLSFINNMEYVANWLSNEQLEQFFKSESKVIPVTFPKKKKSQEKAFNFPPIFKGIPSRQIHILMDNGYTEAKDFAKVRVDDLTAIPYIGVGTIRKLRLNGVRFLDD